MEEPAEYHRDNNMWLNTNKTREQYLQKLLKAVDQGCYAPNVTHGTTDAWAHCQQSVRDVMVEYDKVTGESTNQTRGYGEEHLEAYEKVVVVLSRDYDSYRHTSHGFRRLAPSAATAAPSRGRVSSDSINASVMPPPLFPPRALLGYMIIQHSAFTHNRGVATRSGF